MRMPKPFDCRAVIACLTLAVAHVSIVDAEPPAKAARPASELPATIEIVGGVLRPDGKNFRVCSTVVDVEGTYTIPYLQSSPELEVRATFQDDAAQRVALSLEGARGKKAAKGTLDRAEPSTKFLSLAPGEYRLQASILDDAGKPLWKGSFSSVGVGSIIAAVGDSITEGYYGAKFEVVAQSDWTSFPPEAVSRDGRNFPQFAPTSASTVKKPYAFQSWMTELNDELSNALHQPVFIANEGWGGATCAMYLGRVKSEKNWQERMQQLKPNVWLVHLGVNDERAKVPPDQFGKQMTDLVDLLSKDYGALPNRIFVAKPCYDYGTADAALLPAYCEQIDKLIQLRGLMPGPDFFGAYSQNKATLYGDDPVHPNIAGTTLMAQLWSESLSQGLKAGKTKASRSAPATRRKK